MSEKKVTINATTILKDMGMLSANDMDMTEEEYQRNWLSLNGCKVVVVNEVCDNYYDVIVVDKGIMLHAISDYHLSHC